VQGYSRRSSGCVEHRCDVDRSVVFGGFPRRELSDVGAGRLDVDDRKAITVVKGVVEIIVKTGAVGAS
jgi:hypothetical protein